MEIENSVLEGRVGFIIDTNEGFSERAEMLFRRNTFSVERLFQLVMAPNLRPLSISASQNHFDTAEMLHLVRPRTTRGIRALRTQSRTPEELTTLLRTNISWIDGQNVYREEMRYLARGFGRPNAPTDVLIASLAEWQSMWQQGVSGSLESPFESMSSDAKKSLPEVFHHLRLPAISMSEDLGADLHLFASP